MNRNSIEAHLRAAIESAPSGLLMSDAEGRIVLVNKEIERLFGYAREELLGQPIERLIPERFRGSHPGSRAEFRADPRVRAMGAGRDLFGLRKDGTDVPIEIGLTPLATADGMFVLAAVVDISERKRLEEEQRVLNERLRQSQKMEAIGTLAGGIAHDFNNILGGIIGYAELLASQVPSGSTQAQDVDEILAVAMRGRDLVDRILAFSRRQDSVRLPLDLSETVREVQHLLRATLPATVALNVRLPEWVPRVLADATSVHQVLMNLASNAAQAMPSGGVIDLELAPFYVRDSVARANPGVREGPYLSLEVRDNGPGMDPETRARVFEPFFTTKPAGKGTGLGLAMVHGIMSEHGGAVLLASERGAGTQVRCLFPLSEEEIAQADARLPVAAPLRGSGERVVLVDDEPALLRSTARRLEGLGYRVRTFEHPAAAFAAVREDPGAVDLLISDHSMPEMTGADLCAAVKQLRPELPIILLSGFIDATTNLGLQDAGIDVVLQKPVVTQELATACRSALGGPGTAQA